MFLSRFWHLSSVFERASTSLNVCLAQGHEGSRATVGVYCLSAKIACAKGLFAGETGLVGFCVVWTREKLGFISLEGFLLNIFSRFQGILVWINFTW